MAKTSTAGPGLKPSLRQAARRAAVNPVVQAGREHLGGERPPEAWDDVRREYVDPEELESRMARRQAGHPHVFGEPDIPRGMPADKKVSVKLSEKGELHTDELQFIELELIVESPDNPRQEFDPVALQELADGIKVAGLLQPLLVLPGFGGSHELVDGARRLRACVLAGLRAAPCLVRNLDPKAAALARLEANAKRLDINPLEKARAIDQAIKQRGATQAEIGKALGIEQSTVSNHLRMLRLPEAWHRLIADGTLTEAHAKPVIPFAEYSDILQELYEDATMPPDNWNPGGPGSVRDWERKVKQAVANKTRSMNPKEYNGPKFKATAAQIEQLAIIKTVIWDGQEERATNVPLWDELQKDALAKAEARRTKREAAAKSAAKSGHGGQGDFETRAKLAEQRNKRLFRYKIWWLQGRCADALDKAPPWILTSLLLHWACEGSGWHERLTQMEVKRKSGSKINVGHMYRHNIFGDLQDVKAPEAQDRLVRDTLFIWLMQSAEGANSGTPPHLVESAAKALDIDFARDWQPQSEYLDLCTHEQLCDLAKFWRLPVGTALKRGELQTAIQQSIKASGRTLAVPDELKTVEEDGLLKRRVWRFRLSRLAVFLSMYANEVRKTSRSKWRVAECWKNNDLAASKLPEPEVPARIQQLAVEAFREKLHYA